MAVPSSPAASAAAAATAADSPGKKVSSSEQMEVEMGRSEIQEKVQDSKQSDHTPSSGVRVVGARVYDPQNGKTCHQCRQKIVALAAGCKNMKKDKQCTMKFCQKCLRNRYGEIAEEMEALNDWKCPKCRGICNCSLCMKKRGLRPTGILVHAAKATGFSSVSELLHAKGAEACQGLIVKNRIAASGEGPASSKKKGKENLFDETSGTNLNSQTLPSSADENEGNKSNQEGLRENAKVAMDSDTIGEVAMDSDDCIDPAAVEKEVQKKKAKIKCRTSLKNRAVDVVLPPGTLLISVNGIDLCPEDVGCALQFLEFCSTFGEVLEIRKGQPESVLRDIMSERGRRKGKYSSAVQFLIQLLSFILKGEEEAPSLSMDSEKDSWILPLKKCISESDCVLEGIPKDCFDKGFDGYEILEPSQKLKLLTFLCDEALCTIEMRNWIEDQNSRFVEKVKEARETLNAAKEKERLVKLKLQDEVAKEVTATKGDLLTNSGHDSVVSEIQAEAEQARVDLLKAMDALPKKRQRSFALRTQSILLDDKDRVFWRLNCCSDLGLLLQDIGDPHYQLVSNEKWFSYDAAETKVIEKHISTCRVKRRRLDKLDDPLRMINCNSGVEADSSSDDSIPPPPFIVNLAPNDDSTPLPPLPPPPPPPLPHGVNPASNDDLKPTVNNS